MKKDNLFFDDFDEGTNTKLRFYDEYLKESPCYGFLHFMHLNGNNCGANLLKSDPSGCFQN